LDNWTQVRHIPPDSTTWYQAADQLQGTAEYGVTASGDVIDPAQEWSKRFDEERFNEFLFISGKKSRWMIMGKEDAAFEPYGTTRRLIKQSSVSYVPYFYG